MKKTSNILIRNQNTILHYGFGNMEEFKRQMDIKDQAKKASSISFDRIFKKPISMN